MNIIENTFDYDEESMKETGGYYRHTVFDNGYGASVISHKYSYGGDQGLFEIGVTHGSQLCYSTPVTEDVIGYLDHAGVMDVLMQINALPPTDYCTHRRRDT